MEYYHSTVNTFGVDKMKIQESNASHNIDIGFLPYSIGNFTTPECAVSEVFIGIEGLEQSFDSQKLSINSHLSLKIT